jgi:pimeloyl-ACP methyl ester carboxylesterase
MLTLLLTLAVVADTSGAFRIPVTVSESLAVTVSGKGATLVVIPGLAGSAFAFRRLTPLLVATGHRVVIVEPLGMGTSARPERADYSLEAQAGRVAAVLDTLAIRQALVMGHALGGSIALRMTLARPDLARGVVLMEGGAAEQAATIGFRRAMLFAPWIKMMGGQALIRKQLRKSLAKSSADPGWITDEVIEGYSRGVVQNLDQTLRGYLRMVEAHDRSRLVPRLGLLRLPVLLILGAAPHEGGPDSREVDLLTRGLPFFSMRLVAQAGHHIHEERPCELAGLIDAFDAPRP